MSLSLPYFPIPLPQHSCQNFSKEGQNRPFQSLTRGGKRNSEKHRNEASIVCRKLQINPGFTESLWIWVELLKKKKTTLLFDLWKNRLMSGCMVQLISCSLSWLSQGLPDIVLTSPVHWSHTNSDLYIGVTEAVVIHGAT